MYLIYSGSAFSMGPLHVHPQNRVELLKLDQQIICYEYSSHFKNMYVVSLSVENLKRGFYYSIIDYWSHALFAADIVASFMLQKTVSELSGSTSKLEFDIYEEIGIPNSTVRQQLCTLFICFL